jgi:hypothetical protein
MEHVERYPGDLARRKILLKDDCFEMEYSSPIVRHRKEFRYEDMKPCFGTGSMGDSGWGNMGGWVFVCGLVCFFICDVFSSALEVKAIKAAGVLIFLLFITASLILCIMRFIKHECVWVYDKNDDTVAHIRVTESSKDFIAEFRKRIEQANKI